MDILNKIYCGTYDPHANFPYTEEYRTALITSSKYWDKVSKAFSKEFVNELRDAQSDVTTLECQYYYRKGFYLGFQIALAGMSSD